MLSDSDSEPHIEDPPSHSIDQDRRLSDMQNGKGIGNKSLINPTSHRSSSTTNAAIRSARSMNTGLTDHWSPECEASTSASVQDHDPPVLSTELTRDATLDDDYEYQLKYLRRAVDEELAHVDAPLRPIYLRMYSAFYRRYDEQFLLYTNERVRSLYIEATGRARLDMARGMCASIIRRALYKLRILSYVSVVA